jgi:predicted nucleic acid-binding protein
VSEVRRPKGRPEVRRAVDSLASEDLFLSVLSIGEIAKGIAQLRDARSRAPLEAWLAALESNFGDRILPIDAATSRIWGELTASAQKAGRILPAADGLIAATAHRHGLHVMTRNTAHFEPAGVLVINPWESS